MATCCDYYRCYTCNSGWYSWGRWVLLGVIVVAFILFFFLCSCLTARRRRRVGQQPMYGTGWATNNRWGGAGQTYQPQHGQQQQAYNQGWNNQQPAPAYNQTQGGHYGENAGYYGGQQTHLNDMQPPQNTYGGGNVYQAPAGPPPGK